MPSIEQDLLHIRKAVYGREVREAIADGIEQCYTDVEEATQSATHAVRYDTAQTLTAAQKAQARNNIGANEDTVRYDTVQSLTPAQKARARSNIMAAFIEAGSEGITIYNASAV